LSLLKARVSINHKINVGDSTAEFIKALDLKRYLLLRITQNHSESLLRSIGCFKIREKNILKLITNLKERKRERNGNNQLRSTKAIISHKQQPKPRCCFERENSQLKMSFSWETEIRPASFEWLSYKT